MKIRTILSAVLVSGAALTATGCAHNGHEHSVGEVVDDSVITTKVRTALLAEDDVKSFDIKVKTFNGTVQLSGFVDSQWQIDKATQVAASVQGVRTVTNDLIHKPK